MREALMRLDVLALRVVLAMAAAWLLLRLFFEGGGPVAIIGFAALMVGAAYIIEWMKRDRTKEQV
jgi:hypothetical protein